MFPNLSVCGGKQNKKLQEKTVYYILYIYIYITHNFLLFIYIFIYIYIYIVINIVIVIVADNVAGYLNNQNFDNAATKNKPIISKLKK